MQDKIQRIAVILIAVTAVTELALSQLSIGIMRLSAEELTGISYFAFIILGLVTLFAVSRMSNSFLGTVFAVLMNFITAFAGLWCLHLLFSDEIFFRNLYYNLDRQTQVLEMISLNERILASVPLGLIVIGISVYCLCGFFVVFGNIAAYVKTARGNR